MLPKPSSPPTFCIRLSSGGLVQLPTLEVWECRGRKLVLHQDEKMTYAVSDYLTGIRLTEHKTKAGAKRGAQLKLAESLEREAAGSFSWAAYPQVNTPEFLRGWTAVHELLQSKGAFLDGVRLAIESLQPDPLPGQIPPPPARD